MNDYFTIYRKDYVPRDIGHIERNTIKQEFRDPVTEGFKHYLELDKKDIEQPKEDGIAYMEKIKERYKKVGKMYFPKGIDKNVILEEYLNDGRTKYQLDYCDLEAMKNFVKKTVTLPLDSLIPLTTQKLSYRNPVVINPAVYEPMKVIRPPNNLGQDEKINQILKVKTGSTEYMRVIGKLGNYIVTEELHGKLTHIPFTAAE